MAWPFGTNPVAPNLDTGPGIAVPTSPTPIDTVPCWLLGAHFTNQGSASITVTMTDDAGGLLCKLKIPMGGEQPYEWPFRPAVGVKWSADLAGLKGHVWGYK